MKYLFILLLVSMPASAATTCISLGNGMTQCFEDNPERLDPGESAYSTCYVLDDDIVVCEES